MYTFKIWNQCDPIEGMESEEASLCLKSDNEAPGFKGFPFYVIQQICRPNIIWGARNNPSRSILNFYAKVDKMLVF